MRRPWPRCGRFRTVVLGIGQPPFGGLGKPGSGLRIALGYATAAFYVDPAKVVLRLGIALPRGIDTKESPVIVSP